MFRQKPVFKQINQNQLDSDDELPSYDESQEILVSQADENYYNHIVEDSQMSLDSFPYARQYLQRQYILPSNMNSDHDSELHHHLAYIRALTIQMEQLFESWEIVQPIKREYKLVTRTYQQTEDQMCSICLVDFIHLENIVSLDCKHAYHSNCIKNWLEISNFCPLCKCIIQEQ